ncbi:cytochrome c oxidase assembly protein [Marivibrio halodurans]|uniref:Cytochrome c oxidase assembly protein n=1 Tax=Marivibrio halodurans TaxID=2039722 RepID=A0A8J7SKB1_9PROT|nr:cytochrome c oxidase assembly protein [Marivibrio halodurans]MBP5855381.1 cytochrome c oxidase assembly protein [Marivibrio halodurans]
MVDPATSRTPPDSPNGQGEPGLRPLDGAVYLAILALGTLFWWWTRTDPASLPVWAPWDFAPLQFLAFWVAAWWYARGVIAAPEGEQPPLWRILCFAVGLAVTYAVLLTRFEYLAEHMFFLNRIQHVVMHHLGPLLIVLAWPGAALLRGMPAPLARLARSPWLTRPVGWIQQPLIAALLFVGLIGLWLVPSVHFAAMIDPDLYALMNWSMVVDGLLFWSLVLDPRPCPPARLSFLGRCGLAVGVMFPQILLGAMITFSGQDWYDFYHWCGRIYPAVGALRDQMFGGLIVWIPGAMMSVAGVILTLNFMRQVEERETGKEETASDATIIDSGQWT